MNDAELKLLLSLVRISLWDIAPEEETLDGIRALSEQGWNSLLDAAGKQTVCGLLYKSAEKFPEDLSISEEVFFKLMTQVNRITNINLRFRDTEKEVIALLENNGCHPLTMKGSTCAARYPSPELRECGDIDLFIPKDEFQKAVDTLKSSGYVGSDSPDSSVVFIVNGCVIELHRHYFDLHVKESHLPEPATLEAELLMLSAHILKHACGVGVGLRQICDFALAYYGYTGDYEQLDTLFRKAGLRRWHRLLLSFTDEYLAPSPRKGTVDPRPLCRIILRGGNFGHYEKGRSGSLQRSSIRRKADTALRLVKRLPFSLRFARREAFPYLFDLTHGNLSK